MDDEGDLQENFRGDYQGTDAEDSQQEWYSPLAGERPASIPRRLLHWLLALVALLFYVMVFLVAGVWLLYQFGEAAVNLLRGMFGGDD